ncbi:two-component regulator propeller domain-containing protein [Arenibacter sp. GZD96]|uniref:two-component regulator propeller domain-containing protein n=1 Tax=Aurantibrevibacter litoralis TaxID=3106030 RepID=UPI002AFF6B20|nr:two-component regulator propeller domain-containing protein [Arenibacter sp. GZD-96]MEA1786221.1 two-component regulator propeller domain-containing protein [Arenibacter sp. GZD-96]
MTLDVVCRTLIRSQRNFLQLPRVLKRSCLLVFFCIASVSAQLVEDNYVFVPIEQNATLRGVNKITQDYQGFLWMATVGGGLIKFDGVNFTTYKQDYNQPYSLNSSIVYVVYEDSANRLWVGTEAGLNRYNRDLDIFEEVMIDPYVATTHKLPIRAIVEDQNGALILGTHYNGAYALNPETLKAIQIPLKTEYPIFEQQINSLVKNGKGTVFAGTNIGLFEYQDTVLKPVIYPNEKEDSVFQQAHIIESMLVDDDGSLWLGTFGLGIIKLSISPFNSLKSNHLRITDKRILALTQSPEGHILVGTENDGLFVLDKDGSIMENYRHNKDDSRSIKSNSIWSVFVDHQERIWMGTYNKGVAVSDKFFDKFKDLESIPNEPNSLQSSSVTAIIKDKKNRLWIGLDGGGIDVYDLERNEITHLSDPENPIAKGLNSLDVLSLFMDSADNLWVGTWKSGIFYLPKGQTSFVQYNMSNTAGGLLSNRIMSFAEDNNGVIWIGTFLEGLHAYDTKTKKFTQKNNQFFRKSTLDQRYVRKVFVGSDQSIWLGTSDGLFRAQPQANGDYTLSSMKEKMYQNKEVRIVVDVIVSIFEDKNKNIWVGTDGDGLFKYIPEEDTFVWYNGMNGLKHETVASIVEDTKGNIWLGGNKGLSYLDVNTEAFVHYDTNDGLLANDFNFNSVFSDADGILYFGSYNGITIVDLENIPVNRNLVTVSFTDFKLFNASVSPNSEKSPLEKAISETKEITLNHRQSVFTIDFVGINFTRPEKNQYAYFLEGFDEGWNYVGNRRSATYTNLAPGVYNFKVKATNNDGLWNDTPTQLKITVLAPWWNTKTAWLSYLLLFGIILYTVVKFADTTLREKRLAKFERDRRIQEEELHEKKIQFFTNISHEFRTPLTLILNPLEDLLQQTALQLPSVVTEKHKIIHKNASRLKRLIDELMDFRKLQLRKMAVNVSQIHVNDFVSEVISHFDEEASLKNIILSIETDDMPVSIWSDPGKLEKIIFNILSNAFKITPENGTITVGIFLPANKVIFPLISENEPLPAVEIYIEDTGTGINKEEVNRVFQRFYQVKHMNSQYIGGTGIGLEVVKSFTDLIKGTITVESEEGVGTRFRIFLPLGNSHFKPNELFSISINTGQTSKNSITYNNDYQDDAFLPMTKGLKKTLLLIEDNTELRAYIKHELEQEYNVLQASHGLDGLAIARHKIPDVIITDVIMPEMDGFEFCIQIRQELKTSHIPILMLTAKSMNEDWVKGIDSGADVYMSKPFDMKVLRAQLNQMMVSRQALIKKYLKDVKNTKIPDNTSMLDKDFITKVLDYIHKNIADEDLNVEQLAGDLHLSRSQLYRKIKSLTGQTANEFLRTVRLEKAKDFIESGDVSISEVCYQVGFSSPSYFTKCFKNHFGILPTELKRI